MPTRTWLNQDHQFAAGAVLFQSPRTFSVWAYALSHSQLLLRSRTPTFVDGTRQRRIDILFKPVEAMKTRMDYDDGIVLRCADHEEHERITAETRMRANARIVMIEGSGIVDYVVAGAVGWQEDEFEDGDPSDLAFFVGGTDPTRLLPTSDAVPWSKLQADRG